MMSNAQVWRYHSVHRESLARDQPTRFGFDPYGVAQTGSAHPAIEKLQPPAVVDYTPLHEILSALHATVRTFVPRRRFALARSPARRMSVSFLVSQSIVPCVVSSLPHQRGNPLLLRPLTVVRPGVSCAVRETEPRFADHANAPRCADRPLRPKCLFLPPLRPLLSRPLLDRGGNPRPQTTSLTEWGRGFTRPKFLPPSPHHYLMAYGPVSAAFPAVPRTVGHRVTSFPVQSDATHFSVKSYETRVWLITGDLRIERAEGDRKCLERRNRVLHEEDINASDERKEERGQRTKEEV